MLSMLACPHCADVRCPQCVREEIVCYFCPACLNEVPSATFKAGRGRCSRQCFRCPLCATAVSTIGNADDTQYWLACNVCRWSSRPQGLVGARITDLAAAVQAREVATDGQLEFERLSTAVTNLALAMSLPSAPTTKGGLGGISGSTSSPAAGSAHSSWPLTPAAHVFAVPSTPAPGEARPVLQQRLAVPGVDQTRITYVDGRISEGQHGRREKRREGGGRGMCTHVKTGEHGC